MVIIYSSYFVYSVSFFFFIYLGSDCSVYIHVFSDRKSWINCLNVSFSSFFFYYYLILPLLCVVRIASSLNQRFQGTNSFVLEDAGKWGAMQLKRKPKYVIVVNQWREIHIKLERYSWVRFFFNSHIVGRPGIWSTYLSSK